MDDRELLEMAGKAHGYVDDATDNSAAFGLHKSTEGEFYWIDGNGWTPWVPADDDGQALRLAVKLGVVIDVRYTKPEIAEHNCVNYWLPGEEDHGWRSIEFGEHTDPNAATRRAIVLAAAAMGEQG